MAQNINIRLKRLEELCNEHLVDLLAKMRTLITRILTLEEEDAFWSGVSKAQACHDAGQTPEELQAQLTHDESEVHWKFCLNPEAWSLYCDWLTSYCVQKGIEPPMLETFEEVKLQFEQRGYDGDQR